MHWFIATATEVYFIVYNMQPQSVVGICQKKKFTKVMDITVLFYKWKKNYICYHSFLTSQSIKKQTLKTAYN